MIKYKYSKNFLIMSLLLTIPLVAVGCTKKTVTTGAKEPTKVKVASVNKGTLQTDVDYSSKLISSNEITIAPKVTGRIDNVKVEVGTHVKKGDVLATIDSRELQAAYDQAKGAFDSATATYVKTTDSSFEQQLISAKSTLDSAQASYNDAMNNFNTIKREYNIGDATKESFDAAKLKLDSATSTFNSAKQSLEILQSKVGPQSNAVSAAQVKQSQASLEAASLQLSNASITAPADGVVTTKNVTVGQLVSSATSAFTIIDENSLVAEVNMTDKSVLKVKNEQKVPVKIDALGDKSIEGTVYNISPAADSKTQLYTVKVHIDNSENLIKAGMVAVITFPNDEKNDILIVPNEAIFTQNAVEYVYIVVDGKIKKVEVETGISNTSNTEIIKGVNLGDNVITEGQNFLSDGQAVSILKN